VGKNKKVVVIGSGFAGLAAAANLAYKGFEVTVLEKNATPGGRARTFDAEGFTFDMGPSWYWMPDVFEHFFERLGRKRADYYELIRLDPSYTVTFADGDVMRVPATLDELEKMFEHYEAGSSQKLKKFLAEAEYKYKVGMGEFVQKPSHSIFEFADLRVLSSLFRLQMLTNMRTHVGKLFKNKKLRDLLEFPVLFLGATPQNTPAMYSLMNYADIVGGTWYPKGGMFKIIEAMLRVCEELGVKVRLEQNVTEIVVKNGMATQVITEKDIFDADFVVGGADYHHLDQKVLKPEHRNYDEKYWDKRTMAPSSLLFYLGVKGKISGLEHHNLFFDEDFDAHAHEIYTEPRYPAKPLFYASAPSKTDDTVAPEGCENLFLLIPLAPDLEDNEETRELYYDIIMTRLERWTGQEIRSKVIYKRSFAHNDFKQDYNAYKGNAYGLANTLLQTAFLKPKLRAKKIKNFYFTGQLTVPGPGVPPSLISGAIVADEIEKYFK
jgi:phytoene desaturase